MPDESIVVRPPEFEKVLEELHVVRLSGHLKSEIQARRDLEDIYQQLLQDVTDLEEAIETGRSDVRRAQEDMKRAQTDQTRAQAEQVSLEKRLFRTKMICYLLAATTIASAIIAWDEMSALVVTLLSQFVT